MVMIIAISRLIHRWLYDYFRVSLDGKMGSLDELPDVMSHLIQAFKLICRLFGVRLHMKYKEHYKYSLPIGWRQWEYVLAQFKYIFNFIYFILLFYFRLSTMCIISILVLLSMPSAMCLTVTRQLQDSDIFKNEASCGKSLCSLVNAVVHDGGDNCECQCREQFPTYSDIKEMCVRQLDGKDCYYSSELYFWNTRKCKSRLIKSCFREKYAFFKYSHLIASQGLD